MSERWEEIRDEINNVYIPLPASGDTRWDQLGIAAKRIAAAEKVVEAARPLMETEVGDYAAHLTALLILKQALDNTPKGEES